MRWNAVSAFANCGRAVAHVQGSYVPISRHRAHGGAELRWNADTFAEMHRSIAVAACEE
jgi:hypothetical protein